MRSKPKVYAICLSLLMLQDIGGSQRQAEAETTEVKLRGYKGKRLNSSGKLEEYIEEYIAESADSYPDSELTGSDIHVNTQRERLGELFPDADEDEDCNGDNQLRPPTYLGTTNTRKRHFLVPYTCQPNGTHFGNFDCPIVHTKRQSYALCSRRNISDIMSLNLPQNITVLCLDNNKIRSIGAGAFAKYPNLRFLELSDNLHLTYISEVAFKAQQNLIHFFLSNTTVKKLHPNTFAALSKLQSLSLAFWSPEALHPLNPNLPYLPGLAKTHLRYLDLSGINKRSAGGTFWDLRPPTFSVCRHFRHLTHLWLKHNQIIAVREGVFSNFENLKNLWLSKNLLLGGDKGVVFHDLQSMRNLRFLDMGYQNFVRIFFRGEPRSHGYGPAPPPGGRQANLLDADAAYEEEFMDNECNLVLPPKLHRVCLGFTNVVKDINIDNLHVCGNNSLREIHANNVYMRHIYKGVLRDLPHLKFLDLYKSRIVMQNPKAMQNLSNLTKLNLEFFNLDWILPTDDAWFNLTKYTKFPNLETLNVAHNYLKRIPPRALLNFTSLKLLNLSFNFLQEVPIQLQSFKHLHNIDLRSNELVTISRDTMLDWRSASRTRHVTIDLSNNTITCTCNDAKMIEIAQNANQTLKLIGLVCHFYPSKEIINVLEVNLLAMRGRCQRITYTYAFYFTYAAILLLCLVLSITYRCRHLLQYIWYYLKYMKMQHFHLMQYGSMITHDVFFCCALDDLGKMEDFYKKMENVYNYRLFINERDGMAGKTETDGIKDAFSCCLNVVLVVSPKAIRGRYFKYITHLARELSDRRRSKVVCLFLDQRHLHPEWLVPDALDYLMSTTLCMPWNNATSRDPLFWMRLQQALGPPMVSGTS